MIADIFPGGGIFDTGPGFVFNLGGGPGIRVHQFGGGRPRRRPGTAQPPGSEPAPSVSNALSSLLPLLLLFILPLLSSLFGGGSTPQGPSVVFDTAKPPNTQERISHRYKVPYWVNPVEVEDYSTRKWKRLDEVAEAKYMHLLNVRCEYESQQQKRLEQEAYGWLSVDQEKLSQARKMEKKNCKKLNDLGINTW